MHKWKKLYLPVIALLVHVAATAQNVADSTDTAGAMRSNGKIFVVVAIILTILAGLVLYVARLDRKISKMEKEG